MKLGHRAKYFVRLLTLTVVGVVFYGLFVQLGLLMPLSTVPKLFVAEQPLHAVAAQAGRLEQGQALGTTDLSTVLADHTALSKITLLVEKSRRRLTVFYDLEPVKAYPVVFGSAPEGDKFREGDQKTPEGIYHVRDLYPHPDWSKFIWLDYPTPQDWREHLQAKLSGKIGPLTSIGSEIGIHGVPDGGDGMIDQRVDWTWGCVSLKNADVDELYAFLQAGTLVEIVP